MALTHLIDTSVVSRLGEPAVREVIEPLVNNGRVGRAGITDLEVGYGSRNAKEWEQDMADLSIFDLVETTADHVRRARQVQRLLASRSQRGRKVPDLLIAAAAEEAGLTLLHYDSDFDHIASLTGQNCQWVVPQGSID
ncbi:MAG TPA: PIN domain nuclease [Acidimicrobiales bacterium]|nr:PIN domain nuclease [Acidimicrobiales bacterium]